MIEKYHIYCMKRFKKNKTWSTISINQYFDLIEINIHAYTSFTKFDMFIHFSNMCCVVKDN